MFTLTPHLARGVQVAAAFVSRELALRQRLNPDIGCDEIWACLGFDGRILVGHPVLRAGEGLYVDQLGQWKEA